MASIENVCSSSGTAPTACPALLQRIMFNWRPVHVCLSYLAKWGAFCLPTPQSHPAVPKHAPIRNSFEQQHHLRHWRWRELYNEVLVVESAKGVTSITWGSQVRTRPNLYVGWLSLSEVPSLPFAVANMDRSALAGATGSILLGLVLISAQYGFTGAMEDPRLRVPTASSEASGREEFAVWGCTFNIAR